MAVEDGGPPLPNGTSTSEDFDGQECAELVAAALQTLTPREEQVLRALYGFAGLGEWSYAAVARRYRHSTKTIRKIKETALRKLRHPSRSRRLREFWES
jgi:RNA polymerase primary sigma factor